MSQEIEGISTKTGEVAKAFPLTGLQAGMLFHASSNTAPGQDIVQVVCRFADEIALHELQQKWEQVVACHDALRLGFEVDAELGPRQSVHPAFVVPVMNYDWSTEIPFDEHERLEAFLELDRRSPFQLDCPPLFRVAVIKMRESISVMVWTFHHIILDGRAIPLVLREVLGNGTSRSPQAVSSSYCDYLAWFAEQRHQETIPFWREYLGSILIPSPLPYCEMESSDRGVVDCSSTVHKIQVCIDSAQHDRLTVRAKEYGVSVNTMLQAAWGVLLARSSGLSTVCFGTIRSCRYGNVPNAAETVGMFTNAIPVAIEVREEDTVSDWLNQIYANHKGLRTFEHTPQSVIRTALKVPMSVPFYESMLAVETHDYAGNFEDFLDKGEKCSIEVRQQTGIPITVAVSITDRMTIRFLYDRRKFTDRCIDRMLHQFLTLLDALSVSSPQTRVSEIGILPEYQKIEQIEQFNRSERDASKDIPLHQMFLSQAKRTPFDIAVKSNCCEFTYEQIDRWSAFIAEVLKEKGIQPGTPIGVFLDRSIEAVAAILGVLRFGSHYVPLPMESPPDRLALMIANVQVRLVLCAVESQGLLGALGVECMVVPSLPETKVAISRIDPGVELDSLFCVIFTSGTTGVPKGVSLTHRGYANLLWHRTQKRFREGDFKYSPLTAPWNFDASIVQMFSPLVTGGTLVLYPSVAELGCSEDYHQLTVLTGASSMIAGLVRKHGPPRSAKAIGLGADSMPTDLLQLLNANPNFERLITGYGVTECTCYSTDFTVYDRSRNGDDARSEESVYSQSIVGYPIANAKVYIFDPRKRLLPLGATGEIFLGGLGVANGYIGADELTDTRFCTNPIGIGSADLLYQTGDLGRWREDGALEFLGRKDSQIKLNGYRIEIGEIEANLSQIPLIRQAVVVVREDKPGERHLVAYCIKQHDATFDDLEVKNVLRRKLPEYMIPSWIVSLNEFQFTSNGKIDLGKLPVPSHTQQYETREHKAPSSPIEFQLHTIWKEVLGKSDIGIRDNFFDLGGDSLAALNLFVRIKRQLGVSLPLALLFTERTIEQLANRIESSRARLQNMTSEQFPNLSIVHLETGHGDSLCDPLYVMPSLFGELLFAKPIIDRLGSQVPVYGVQPTPEARSYRGEFEFCQIAREYAQVIRSHQIKGPINLLGYSFGGFLAFEVARQLKLQEQQVGLLGIIDTGPENRFKREGLPSHLSYTMDVVKNFPRWLYDLRDAMSLARMAGKMYRKLQYIYGRRGGSQASELHLGEIAGLVGMQEEYLNRSDQLRLAIRSYVPEYYPGTVHLFRARTRPLLHSHTIDLGWERLVDEVKVTNLPGNHETILGDPSVSLMSAQLLQLMVEVSRS